MVTTDMNLVQVSKLEGVNDLPLPVRGPFAKALMAEARGDHKEAAKQLDRALAAEAR